MTPGVLRPCNTSGNGTKAACRRHRLRQGSTCTVHLSVMFVISLMASESCFQGCTSLQSLVSFVSCVCD